MAPAKVDARSFEMLYADPLLQLKGGAPRLGKMGKSWAWEKLSVNLETLTPVVTTTPSGIDMENTKPEDVTSLSVVYVETLPSKIGAAFDNIWESNKLINECLEGLRNDKLEREKQQQKEAEEREKRQKKEAEEREKWEKEQEARFLAMEKRSAALEQKAAALEQKAAALEQKAAALEQKVATLEKQRVADKQKHDKDVKYLKDEIAARDVKIEALEAKVESQATTIRTLNQARHDDQEAYRVLTARIQPLFLHVLLDDARDKIAQLLGHSWWDDISSNQPPSQLPTWLAQQSALKTDYTLTNNSVALLCQFNPIRQEGNNAAHTATTEEIREAILSKQQEGMRVVLKNLFEFTYAKELPLTTS